MSMLNKNKTVLFFMLSLVAIICAIFALSLPTVNAATNKNQEYSDEFSDAEFSEQWQVDGAQLVTDYHALALIDFNDWGPSVNLVNYKIENNSTITFELDFKSGTWIGLAFGFDSNTTRFYYGQSALIMSSINKNAENENGTRLMTRKSGQLASSTMADNPTYETLFNQKRIVLKLEIDADDNITVYKAKPNEKFERVGTFENCFYEGYIGFGGMSKTCVDIYSFKYEKDGQLVYYDDFTTSKLGYQSTGVSGNDWFVSFKYDSTQVKLGGFNHVNIGAGDSLTYSKAIRSNSLSQNVFDASFLLGVEELTDGAFAGIAVGMSEKSNLKSGSFIGFGKESDFYYLAHIKNGEVVEIKETYRASEFSLANENLQVNCSAFFGGNLSFEVLGKSYDFEHVIIDGFFGIGVLADKSLNCVINIDDFVLDTYAYKETSSDDLSINFNGYKEEILYGYSVKNYYINPYKFYKLGNLKQPMDYKDGQGYLRFDCLTDNSALIPKANYSEAIVRFDIKMNATAAETTEYARLGVGFGLLSQYYSPTSSSYVFFQNQKNYAGAATPTVFGCSGADVAYVYEEYDNFSGNYISCDYDIWGDTQTIYNFMLVAENNSIKVYFKEDGQPESQMEILRAQFINANTYGHIAIFGNMGAKFDLLNLSITNVNPYKDQADKLEGYQKDGAALSGAVSLNDGESITTASGYNNSLTYAKISALGGVKIYFGEHNLTLSESGVVASENLTLLKNDFNFSTLKGDAYLRVETRGDKMTVCIRNGGSETQLYQTVIECSVAEKSANSKIKFEAVGGKLTINGAYTVSLNAKIDIATENYDAELEKSYNNLVVKPEKAKDSDATLWIVLGSVGAVVVSGTIVGVILVAKKRRAK